MDFAFNRRFGREADRQLPAVVRNGIQVTMDIWQYRALVGGLYMVTAFADDLADAGNIKLGISVPSTHKVFYQVAFAGPGDFYWEINRECTYSGGTTTNLEVEATNTTPDDFAEDAENCEPLIDPTVTDWGDDVTSGIGNDYSVMDFPFVPFGTIWTIAPGTKEVLYLRNDSGSAGDFYIYVRFWEEAI